MSWMVSSSVISESDLLRDEFCRALGNTYDNQFKCRKIESNRIGKYSLQEELNSLPWLGVLLACLRGFRPLRMDGQGSWQQGVDFHKRL